MFGVDGDLDRNIDHACVAYFGYILQSLPQENGPQVPLGVRTDSTARRVGRFFI